MPAPRPIEFQSGSLTGLASLASALGAAQTDRLTRDRLLQQQALNDQRAAEQFALSTQTFADPQSTRFGRLQRAGEALVDRARTPTGRRDVRGPFGSSLEVGPGATGQTPAEFFQSGPSVASEGSGGIRTDDGREVVFDPGSGDFFVQENAGSIIQPDGSADLNALAGRELIDPVTGQLDLSAFQPPGSIEQVPPRGVFAEPIESPDAVAIESLVQVLPPGAEGFGNTLRTLPLEEAAELTQRIREKHAINQRASARLQDSERRERLRELRRRREKLEERLDELSNPFGGNAAALPGALPGVEAELAEINAEISGTRSPDLTDPALREPTDSDIDDALQALGPQATPEQVEQYLVSRGFQL
ncbi:MAG: hypothetical protein AAGG38_02205 [Planctomycetota bacterium]